MLSLPGLEHNFTYRSLTLKTLNKILDDFHKALHEQVPACSMYGLCYFRGILTKDKGDTICAAKI
jgi:hypothetical protein